MWTNGKTANSVEVLVEVFILQRKVPIFPSPRSYNCPLSSLLQIMNASAVAQKVKYEYYLVVLVTLFANSEDMDFKICGYMG